MQSLADLGVAQVDALLQEKEGRSRYNQDLQDKRFIAPENIDNPTLSTQATDIYALGLLFRAIGNRQNTASFARIKCE